MAADALREARAVLATRSARPAPADLAYAVYVGILFALICGTPLVRFVLLALGDPRVQTILTSASAVRWVALLSAGLVVAALLGGQVRGPVVPSPFVAEALGSSALPRRSTMRRPFVRAVAVLVGGGASLAALVLTSMALAGSVRPDDSVAFAAALVAYLLVVAVVWLAGQALAGSTVRVATLLVAAWVVVELLGPVPAVAPWDWLARLWPAASSAGTAAWPEPALAAAAVGALALVPLLLDRLRGPVLAVQSRQWERVGMLARSADLAGAVATFRALPTAGRRLRIPAPAWPPLAFLLRDVVGSLRTPGRAAVGACGLLAAGWLVAAGVAASDGLRWIPVVAGPLLAFLAAGVWCDGFRLAAEAAGRPALFGPPPARHALLHATLPLLVTGVLLGAGAAAHGALEGWSGADWSASAWAAGLGAFLVAVRAADAAKGPLPVALLMPVPTPMGDASSLNVLMWQSDALLVTLVVGCGLTWAFPTGGAAAAAWLALATVAALAWARRRLRVADRPTYGDRALEP